MIPRILSKVYSTVWAVRPDTFRAIHALLSAKVRGELPRNRVELDGQDVFGEKIPQPETVGTIRVIPVAGVIGRRLSNLEIECGGCDLVAVDRALDEAKNDPAVKAVCLVFDTPGGTVTGVPETARKIAELGKPTLGWCDTLCCSAGYWMASQCSVLLSTPSADMANVGAYCALVDETLAWEAMGLKLDLFKSGEFKAMGIQGSSLTPEQKAILQQGVDDCYSQFVAAVRSGRAGHPIKDEDLQGQCWDGAQGFQKGLTDGTCLDLNEALQLFAALIAPSPAP